MELRKRDTITNVNFNQKGEKIKNTLFEDEKEDEGGNLGKEAEFTSNGLKAKEKREDGVIGLPGENDNRSVSVSKTPDSSIVISNVSPLEDHEKNAKVAKFKKIFIFSGVFVFILFLVGGYFGLEAKDIYFKKVPLEKVLKGGGQVVFDINSNADFEQYKYLDDNLRKFPGYKLLEKELDDIGEGKTISEALHEKFAEHNLSFNDDIKPVLGDKTLVVVPTVAPLTNELQKLAFDAGDKAKNILRKKELDGKVANAEDALAVGDIAEAGRVKVLGLTSDFYADKSIEPEEKPEPVDFMIGAKIKSLKDAKRVLDKIMGDKNKYEVTEIKFEGYTYYKITRKLEDDDLNDMLISVKDTFHALIGQNWIMATKEADLKEMISARKAEHTLSKMTFWKKSDSKMQTLSQDGDYNFVKRDLTVASQEGIVSVYTKLSEDLLNPPSDSTNQGYQPKTYFKSQEKDLLIGFLFRVTPDGIVLRSVSNQINLSGIKNAPMASGLIQKMPRKVTNKWTDVYAETAGIKNLYYNFKKNNLTEDGIDAINEAREGIKTAFGVNFDLETDLIDHFSGNIALAAFTARNLAPHAFVIVEIDDKDQMLESVQKIVATIKKIQLMPYQMMMERETRANSAPTVPGGTSQDISISVNRGLTPETKKQYEDKAKAIMESQLVEIQTEVGPVYQYKFPVAPGTEEFSINCSFGDGTMMFGTDQAVVTDLVKEFGTGNAVKLTKAEDFNRIVSNIYPDGYSKSFITPLGIWNGISYYMEKLSSTMGVRMGDEERDIVTAVGTVFKTINSVASTQVVSPVSDESAFNKAAIYIDIKEAEKEEKEFAEKILEKF